MKKRITVLGWYHKNNIGDQLFIDAFKLLFPNFDFNFVDELSSGNLSDDVSAVFIGGGSFLNSPVNCDISCWEKLKSIPIFYIGVGTETDFHPSHLELLKIAKLIATRTSITSQLFEINSNVIQIPDIVYYCKYFTNILSTKKEKSVLFLPNIFVVPNNLDPIWKYNSWEHFKTQFSQFLDQLVEDDYHLSILGMCKNNFLNDEWAAIEIINRMNNKNNYFINVSMNYNQIVNLFNSFETIVTQRFHGIILAESCNTNYISISHSDKLSHTNPANGSFISYYEVHKNKLMAFLKKQKNKAYKSHLDEGLFTNLQEAVNNFFG